MVALPTATFTAVFLRPDPYSSEAVELLRPTAVDREPTRRLQALLNAGACHP